MNNFAKDLVLITGASAGIGYEMAKQLAEKKYDLVLVARNIDKLRSIKRSLEKDHGVTVHIFRSDLSEKENAMALYKQIKSEKLEITMLVNNAGSGLYGNFIQTSLDDELAMIDLNVSSLVILTKFFVQDMVKRGYGRIMNLASLLSFLQFPYYSIYSATKTFVLTFTETLAAELEGTGVIITALCPGPVNTGSNSKEMLNTNAYKVNKPINVAIAAKKGVDLLLHGKGKKIVGFNNWFISNLPRITPDKIMMRIKKNLSSQRTVKA